MKDKFALKIGMAIAAVAIVIGLVVVAAPSDASTGTCVYSPLEQRGSNGPCVGYLQRMLNGLNVWHKYDTHAALKIDNDFGPLTEAKVKAYQKSMFIKVDGIVGPQSWQTLCTDARAIFIYGSAPSSVALDVYNAGKSAGCTRILSAYSIVN